MALGDDLRPVPVYRLVQKRNLDGPAKFSINQEPDWTLGSGKRVWRLMVYIAWQNWVCRNQMSLCLYKDAKDEV